MQRRTQRLQHIGLETGGDRDEAALRGFDGASTFQLIDGTDPLEARRYVSDALANLRQRILLLSFSIDSCCACGSIQASATWIS